MHLKKLQLQDCNTVDSLVRGLISARQIHQIYRNLADLNRLTCMFYQRNSLAFRVGIPVIGSIALNSENKGNGGRRANAFHCDKKKCTEVGVNIQGNSELNVVNCNSTTFNHAAFKYELTEYHY